MSFLFWGFVVGFLRGLAAQIAKDPVPVKSPVLRPMTQEELLKYGMLKMR